MRQYGFGFEMKTTLLHKPSYMKPILPAILTLTLPIWMRSNEIGNSKM